MGMVHSMVTEVCDEYYIKMRRRVFQTPKSYLSFIQNFTSLYSIKLDELKQKESRVNLGLQKLIQVCLICIILYIHTLMYILYMCIVYLSMCVTLILCTHIIYYTHYDVLYTP